MKYGTSAKAPAGATASDKSGERTERTKGGVGMGKMDATGSDKKFDTGRTAGTCYVHQRYTCQKS